MKILCICHYVDPEDYTAASEIVTFSPGETRSICARFQQQLMLKLNQMKCLRVF